jgi:hypothetical protein
MALFGPLVERVAEARRPGMAPFTAARSALYGKVWSARFLADWLTRWEPTAWTCGLDECGVAVTTLEDARAAIRAIRARAHHRVVVKCDLGLAGNSMLRLWEPEVLPAQERWMEAQFGAGRRLVVEPWLERVADFSVQFDMGKEGLKLVGYAGLENDLRGQFRSNWAEPRFERRPPAAVLRALGSGGEEAGLPRDLGGRLHGLYRDLGEMLEPRLRAVGHEGPLGVDAFVYRGGDGVARLKPVVEINPRHTMGRVMLELMRVVAPGRVGRFRLWTLKEVRALGHDGFVAFAKHLADTSPWVRAGEPVPRLVDGSVCLNDPQRAQGWLAVLELGG